MLIWCTGISGSGRNDYVREAATFAKAEGGTCKVLDVGELLSRVPDNLRVGPNATSLLDGNEDVLNLHRAFALNELKREIFAAQEETVLVSTHACFMRKGRMMPGFDMNFIRENLLNEIDMFATVIHDCHEVWAELETRPEWKGLLSLAEVAIWRDFETAQTKALADFLGRRFYLLARRDPSSTLARLAKSPAAPSLYLSYPITAIQRDRPELLEEASALADRLRQEGFVVFNPLAIKDVPGTRAAAGVASEISAEMEQAAAVYLNSQTISRDLQLIDQADMVVVYYPTDRVSPGVFTEMSHARDRRKPLYLCAFPGAPESVSPFLGLFYTKAFASVDETIDELRASYLVDV